MNDMLKQFITDSAEFNATQEELATISKLAQDQLDWETRIKNLETDLEHAKESLRQIQEFLLPEAMISIGMSEFKMLSGAKITIKDDVYASVRKDKITDAVQWLDNNGLGDIVKDKVDVQFGRGDSDQARGLVEYCRKNGFNVGETLSIHPQTLKATVKEQLTRGVEFPEELFSIAPVKKAIIRSK